MKKRSVALIVLALALGAGAVFWFLAQVPLVATDSPPSGPRGTEAVAPAAQSETDNTPSKGSAASAKKKTAPETLKIASYNIQSFGRTKIGRSGTLKVLANIGASFDVMAVQEVGSNASSASDETADAVMALYVAKINEHVVGELFDYVRTGQFALVYRKDRLTVNAWGEYTGVEQFAYKPLIVYFKTLEAPFDFVFIDAHLRPSQAKTEMKALKRVMAEAAALYDEKDVICAGDFNADGTYYEEGTSSFPADFTYPEFISVIPNDADTTVASGSFAYDRMELTSSMASDFSGNWSVLKPASLWDLSFCEGTANNAGTESALSDHYPIWAEFYTGRDTD
ncbi:MAG: endonuclease/exonuclease/phosphatase family protein [Treponemataceae bacterium]